MADGQAPARTAASRRPAPPPVAGRAAADKVQESQHLSVHLPVVGAVQLPSPARLVYYGSIGVFAALELIDWPIALLVALGHALSQQQHSQAIRELGEGLEDAG